MPFDLSTAKPVEDQPVQGFDVSTAEAVPEKEFDPMKDIEVFGISGEEAAGGINLAKNIFTGMFAKPAAGAAGLRDVIQGEGIKGAETVKEFTGKMQTPLNEEGKMVAGKIGESLKGMMDNPAIAKLIQSGKEGQQAFAKYGEIMGAVLSGDLEAPLKALMNQPQTPGSKAEMYSNIGGSVVGAVPETALEVAAFIAPEAKLIKGVATAAKPAKGVKKLLSQAAPTAEQLKGKAKEIYSAVDDMGVSIKADAYQKFADDAFKTLDKMGVDKILSPKASRALDLMVEKTGSVKVSEIEKLRKQAKQATKSAEGEDLAMGSALIGKIDDFLEKLTPAQTQGGKTGEVGPMLKDARGLWSRLKKNEKVTEMVNVAENYQSGFESGLRNQATNLLKSISKKKTKGFTSDEIAALQKVSRGDKLQNTMKFLSKFGIGEAQQTNALLAVLGAGAGGAQFGITGAVVLPALGTISGKLALKLTKNKAKFLDEITRAGKNGKKITAAYIKNTPKSQQNVAELTELLIKSDASLKNIVSKNKTVADAVWITQNYSKEQALKFLGILTKKNQEASEDKKQ